MIALVMASQLTESTIVVKHHWLALWKIGNWLGTIVCQWEYYQQTCPKHLIGFIHLLCYVTLKFTVSKTALDLLCSYLWRRLGRVRIGSATSSWRNLERGCSQGSLLGPLYIVEYISERSLIYITKTLGFPCTRTITRSMWKEKTYVLYLRNFSFF